MPMEPNDFNQEQVFLEQQSELLALLLEEEGFSVSARPALMRGEYDYGVPLPLAYEQEPLWFLAQLEPKNPFYNVPLVLRLEGPLRVEALEASLNAIVERHESLRTGFHERDGQPFQVIEPQVKLSLPLLDLSTRDGEARDEALKLVMRREADAAFDLETAPLVRALLVRCQPQEHYFLFTAHHLVFDGWSMAIFFRELKELYRAALANEQTNLAPLPIQYADYARWQREWLQGEALAEELAFWQQEVEGAPTFLELPSDHPRSHMPGFQGASQEFALPAALTEQLKAFARQEDCTLYMLLLAGLEVVLSRYSRQEDFLLGTPVHTRRQVEAEGLIGMLVNTLVVRADVQGEPGGRELVRRVRERLLTVQGHAELPLEKLVEVLKPERVGSATPLVQVVFAWEELPPANQELGPGLRLRVEPWASHTAKFELTLLAWETPEGIQGVLEYNTALHEAASMTRLLAHWQEVLRGLVANPEQSIQHIQILSEEERARQVVEWNQTAQAFSRERCVHSIVEKQAWEHPNELAVCDETGELSYRDLNERANQLAHSLREQGVGPEVRVGVCLPRSIDLVVSLLAIWKAGGAYVPLDPNYPRDRLAYMLNDAGALLVLTREDSGKNLPTREKRVLSLDRLQEELSGYPITNVESGVSATHLAYVMYTSGSTGTPKGVQIIHRNIAQLVYAPTYAPLSPQDRVGCMSSVAFDALTFEIWATLAHGARLICLSQDVILQPQALASALRQYAISILFMTTALVNQVAQQEPGAFAELQALLFGGEAVEPRWIQAIMRTGAPRRLLHMYGPTECTTFALSFQIESVAEGDTTIPIGRPIGNARAYVLDAYLQPVPIGVVGELYLGGEGPARGYLNQPVLTAERFVPDPFSESEGARLYRTGDLVRAREDGTLVFVGREDGQVKLRGYRIESGEIESQLRKHPAVRSATVILREDRPGDKRLVAYLVRQSEEEPASEAMREFARARLPEYMVPAAFAWLEALPLTPNGKIDKRALPQPHWGQEEILSEEQLPRTETEERLASIWREVLAIGPVSREANFFELGGHSLLATQLVSRVRSQFHINLPLRALFESPTLARLAEQIEAARPVEEQHQSASIPGASRQGDLHPSFAQERFWFLNQLEPENTAYNMPVAFRLEGDLRLDIMKRSFDEIVRRHEALRTTFVEVQGVPVQRIREELSLELPLLDLTGMKEDEWDAEVQRRLTIEARQPFDLERGPLLRVSLLRLSAETHVLFLTMHHIISDGWSLSVFMREFGKLYSAFAEGQPSPLADLTVQYADYVSWQREQLRGEALKKQQAYWEARLANRPPSLELPTDYPRPATQNFQGAGLELVLSEHLTGKLKALSQREDGTLFMVLLSAFSILLGRYSGQDDLLVGVPIAGRTRSEFESLIGLFLNTLVLRVNLEEEPTFLELLSRVREATLGAYAHQDLPFEYLVEVLQPERYLNRNPLFEVMLNLANMPQTELRFPNLNASSLELTEPEAKLPITLYIYERQDELLLQLVYQRALFSEQRMRLFLSQFQALLEQIVEAPERVIDTYSLLTPDSRHLIPDPTEILPEPYCEPITNLIKAWADDPRELPAVWQAGREWSYRELIERAEVIARVLVKHGVRRGDTVAIQGTRSFGLYATLVGTLMSGGVLLALDRTLPLRRQEVMAREARAKYLIRLDAREGEDLGELGALDSFAVDGLSGRLIGVPEEDLQAIKPPEIMQDDPAYLIFTSGTTGVPKGILGRHKSLSHFLTWQRMTFDMGPGDRCAQMTSLSFDVVLRDIFMPLVSGAALYVPEEYAELMPERIIPWLARERITAMHIVPTMAQSWLNDETVRVKLPSMRRVFIAGEPLRGTLVQRWREAFGGEGMILNLYGPAETTLAKCCYRVPDEVEPGVQPVGWPLPEAQMLVMGRGGQLCGIGEPGEIVIRTPFRSLGYINVSEENRKRFVKNPFRDNERDLLYHSGDRGRYALDGKLEILGRVDEQVKIRGVRVEPHEIEVILQQHPAIQAAIVRAYYKESDGEKQLAAYIVPTADWPVNPTESELRRFLRTTLPEYMVPSAFVWLKELPLTLNGKLDWRALPTPEPTVTTSENYSAPRTPIEEQVAGIWAQVLKREVVGINDNFFELGGHSLLAVQIISRLREACLVEVPLRALFEEQTVAALAARIEHLRARDQGQRERPIIRADRDREFPLSFPQQRLWFLDQWEPNNPFFNVSRLVSLQGPLCLSVLEQCLNTIIQRHEPLRTIIVAQQGRPAQVILPELRLTLPAVDLSKLPMGERDAEMRRQARAEAQRTFDLSRGPLIRARLFCLSDEEHALTLTVHHIVSDAWSLSILLQELGMLYDALTEDENSAPLAELPVQYVDYTLWQEERLHSRAPSEHADGPGETLMERQLSYWREHLRGAPPMLALPTDRPRPPLQTFRGAQYPFKFSPPLAVALKALAQREGVTLSMTMLAAFQTLLFRYTGQEDIVIGSTNANRTRVEIEGLIGCFFDIQALRTNLGGNPTFRELLGRVREVALAAYTNQDLPFGKIVEELQPERSLSHPPYFQVAFSLQHMPVTTLELARLTLNLLDIDTGTSRLDLMIFLWEHEQDIIGTIEYNTDLFDASTIERFIIDYQRLLEGIVEQPEQRISELARRDDMRLLELLGPVERQVELRGYRIRLGEIEKALLTYPGVRESVVMLREDQPGERQLVAYVAPSHDQSGLANGELRQYLEKRLPDYMLPARFVLVDAFQMDANGQIDLQALPRPEVEESGLVESTEGGARDDIEAKLIEIWTDLLDPEEVALGVFGDPAEGIGIHDDFFALGGHSLLVTQVMSRVQEAFQVELPLTAFFEASTIAELAERIEAEQRLAAPHQAPPLLPVARTGPLPLSFAQERLWFLEQLEAANESGSTAYVILGARHITGRLNIQALERSLGLLVERHESLRTVIVVGEDGRPGQVIMPAYGVELRVSDLRTLPVDEREARVQHIANEEMSTPFDLERGPMLRARLLRLNERSYVLLITIHHIASDGWSQGILYRELAAFYTALCADQQATLSPLPIQYADYAVWQRDWLRGDVMEVEVAYWRERLAGAPGLLELPTDRPRPPIQSFAGATYSFSLPVALADRVRALSQREDVTLFMVLLATFQVLLRYYSGQEDLVIGTPIANRTRIETEGLIGFFVNTLALRTNLEGDPSFRELLGRVREVCLSAYTHQELPFEKLVETLQPERSLSHNPLFQVFFALQNITIDALDLPGAVVEAQPLESSVSKFDLSLYLAESQDGRLQGAIEYSTDLFEQTSIERLVGHYQRLLEVLVANPEQRIKQTQLLTTGEYEQLVQVWNRTEADYPVETHLARVFEEQVARTPEATALIYEAQRVSYRELDRRANRVARALRERGVGPETCVGLCLPTSVEMIVGILGILKAGGAYVPLDPDYPVERLGLMVEDARVPVVLTLSHLRSRLPSAATRFLCLDSDWERITRMPEEPPQVCIQPENLAYVIYTSGSTGRPKGVLATHRATLNRLNWMWQTYPFTRDDICCQKTSLSFVDAVWEIFGPLLRGVPTVLVPGAQVRDPRDLIETLARENVTRLVLVPSLLQSLLDLDARIGTRLPKLKLWSTSGEALPLELLRRFQAALPGCTLLNLYGSSEVAADATCYEVPAASEAGARVSIGRPIANMRVYILDQRLSPLPASVPGEIYIGGIGVARGYQGRADLTAERFIPDPFSKEPGGRLYRTGDRARYLADGTIEYLGRTDQQVKIRGYRIEIGEVEAILKRDERLRDAALQQWQDPTGEKRLVAYLVSAQETLPSVQDLRSMLQRHLPAYMLPSAFVFLDELPLLPNGKLNRQALPLPQLERADLEAGDQEPLTPTEETLAAIWSEVLHLERVGRHENFFELGGDSILTIQVVTRATRAGLRLNARHLFQYQSIAELASVVESVEDIPNQEPEEQESEQPSTAFPLADLDATEFSKLASLLGKMTSTEEPSR